MMKEMFLGNRALFKGLYIFDRYDFKPYPVIHLTFSSLEYDRTCDAHLSLYVALKTIWERLHLNIIYQNLMAHIWGHSLKTFTKFQKHLLSFSLMNTINHYFDILSNQKKKRSSQCIEGFFSPLKDLTDKIKFLFITGVSKFSQVSIFSDLDDLDDLTLHKDYSTIAGFTQEELEHYFKDHIIHLSKQMDTIPINLLNQIQEWYDGYSWDGNQFVYAPFSISNLFKHCAFKNYWFASATPSFLIDVVADLKQGLLSFESFESYSMLNTDMEKYEISNIKLMPFLFQSGYLSIYKIDKDVIKVIEKKQTL
ncbi:MAG: hypothetical protein OMM_11894 [Candidatus Magnetoglobus multicellularis str. Araruama]|uniref:AAA-ATPase-like domain-containing protein n=1 Tax=Candidatus Magnetoglobus multicellularis str. Araruama TaxID=890399 RepID=A0A1V1NXC7_9BACT|nr:MAG: hypothetical protein OMM_11894 [Candidatus Magnetoglobus multicellularis str. Araruama]